MLINRFNPHFFCQYWLLKMINRLFFLVLRVPRSLFNDVLQEDESRFEAALDLLQEIEDSLIACKKKGKKVESGRENNVL